MNQYKRMTRNVAPMVVGNAVLLLSCCAGPRSLDSAIIAADEQAYLGAVSGSSSTPRDLFFRERAAQSHQSVEQVMAADLALSTTKNPFSARKDPTAVSRGAVIYKYNCMNCHGVHADGRGPESVEPTEPMDFHRFSTRFAVTLHGGAPSRWFRVIDEGTVSESGQDPLGNPLVMESFHDTLAREQIWLVVTYLQSLQ